MNDRELLERYASTGDPAAFAALVIFHPELRRMLAELGNLPLFNQQAREQREAGGARPDESKEHNP